MQAISTTGSSARSIHHHDLSAQFLPDDDCLQQRLPDTLGAGHSNIFKLDQDLSYIETHYTPRSDISIWSRIEEQEPMMVVTLALKGHSRFTPRQGDGVVFKQGHTSITTFHASEGARQYQAQQAVCQMRFVIGKSWLERYFGEQALPNFFDRKTMRVVKQQPISASGIIAAQALLNCNVAGKARPLFRQGQAMAILASELNTLLSESRPDTGRFSQRDKLMAERARDVLCEEYQNPPTVEALSRRVGTNQFKLKQLFHHYFTNTPYGLLLEIRMKTAYQLLKSSECSVGIAAEAVGYHHASNFSAAFSKYFGFPPKRLARQD